MSNLFYIYSNINTSKKIENYFFSNCEIKNNYKTLEIYENRLNDSLVSVEEDQYNNVREAVIHKEQKSLYEIINILQVNNIKYNKKLYCNSIMINSID